MYKATAETALPRHDAHVDWPERHAYDLVTREVHQSPPSADQVPGDWNGDQSRKERDNICSWVSLTFRHRNSRHSCGVNACVCTIESPPCVPGYETIGGCDSLAIGKLRLYLSTSPLCTSIEDVHIHYIFALSDYSHGKLLCDYDLNKSHSSILIPCCECHNYFPRRYDGCCMGRESADLLYELPAD